MGKNHRRRPRNANEPSKIIRPEHMLEMYYIAFAHVNPKQVDELVEILKNFFRSRLDEVRITTFKKNLTDPDVLRGVIYEVHKELAELFEPQLREKIAEKQILGELVVEAINPRPPKTDNKPGGKK
jgi:hypothetical protein